MPQMDVSAPVWAKVHELRQKYVQHRVRQRSNNRARSLGTVKLHSSSYQCPWISEKKIGHVMHGGVVVSDDGDSYSSLLGWVEREKRRHSRMEDESFDVEEYPDYYENESASALGGLADDYDSDEEEEEEEEEAAANVQESDDDEEEQDKENANLQHGGSVATKAKDNFYSRLVGLLEEQSLNAEQQVRHEKLATVLSSRALVTMPLATTAAPDLTTEVPNADLSSSLPEDKENIQLGIVASTIFDDEINSENKEEELPGRISLSVNVPSTGSEINSFSTLQYDEGEVETKQQEQRRRTGGDTVIAVTAAEGEDEETWELFEDAEEEVDEQQQQQHGNDVKGDSLFCGSALPHESVEDAVSFSSPVRRLLAVEA